MPNKDEIGMVSSEIEIGLVSNTFEIGLVSNKFGSGLVSSKDGIGLVSDNESGLVDSRIAFTRSERNIRIDNGTDHAQLMLDVKAFGLGES